MEFVAWFTHKYVMHGFLWSLHRDHHVQPKGFFQRNDTFFLIFAIPSWLFIMFGMMNGFDFRIWIGLGIMLYGIAYFLFHEVLIHQRMKKLRKILFRNLDNSYLKSVIKAHHAHHKYLDKNPGESYGMLIIGKKYKINKS
ncbi:MAG: carotene hydroxylase [Candidatus Kapabacteria bacterium]|nr:carotene hydroxylase [Ignavibacteriota bacterium]MCW5885567.1 carotene hydroxylase [Candidatus Kapabacteria bacterium]